jgi:phosphoribosylanthranilate isomerase
MGDWKIWKALRVRDPGGLAEAVAPWLGLVDGLLLDGWHPDLPGGAGVRFDWNRAAAFRSNLPGGLLFVAAGGLTPENVTEVLPLLRPDVVDVSSGVETAPGIKDPRAVRAFIQAVRSAPGPSDP